MQTVAPSDLVLAFIEDGRLCLFASKEDAARAFEGLDAESRVVEFYDRHGTYLEPVFSTPNRYGRLFGLIRAVSGTYALTPRPDAKEDPLALALFEKGDLEPNPWFSSLVSLRECLASEGVAVELHADQTGGGT